MADARNSILNAKTALGIELGSTRIKGVLLDDQNNILASGGHAWENKLVNGVWTYDIEDVWAGLQDCYRDLKENVKNTYDVELTTIGALGISAMMHGYLAFNENDELLVPFRTWRNTITEPAANALTELFQYNIPERWSIAHLYQAILNGEEHVKDVAHFTTLAGYLHFMLTGVNAVGIGEASGIFPVDSSEMAYDREMLAKFSALEEVKVMPWRVEELLPQPLMAGESAGKLSTRGAQLLEGLLLEGLSFAPPEGDAGTGMTATNAVAPRTGNVSAGTSIFSMVVLEKNLEKVYEEIDLVTTPTGKPVAMVHCNNCTNDSNAWVSVLKETANLFGACPDNGEIYTKLYEKALEGDADCGGVLVCNYVAGEGVTHLDEGRPMVVRRPDSKFTLANFFRAQLYSTMSTLKIGMDILAKEQVAIDSLTGHGGLFKTPVVGQKFMAAACNAPVTCMQTAGEGGPYGMALLASYMLNKAEGETLETYLNAHVFADAKGTTLVPEQADVDGFNAYIKQYKALLEVERKAVEVI